MSLRKEKLVDIERLMISSGAKYLWCDCICINQDDKDEQAVEMAKMFEYYKTARKCHILLNVQHVWNPSEIVESLKFIGHILSHMGGAALASDAGLSENLTKRLADWANEHDWAFRLDKMIVRSAAIDMGVLNCYATCINHVMSVFDNLYFTRVWTFQEMILGKNITMWAINPERIDCIGQLDTWMDLAVDSQDKAYKLLAWIDGCRVVNTASVNTILGIIAEDGTALDKLKIRVRGISGARTDIISGGPSWWGEYHKGIQNIFSAISLTPRECRHRGDIFRGLLGIFSGLFSPEGVKRELSGNNLTLISFNFFKQLSTKTGLAWTNLAISSGERGEWDWIPVVENISEATTTDCFAGIIILGKLKPKGTAKASAQTSIEGVPRKYMEIQLSQQEGVFQFFFKGCNCGKTVKAGKIRREQIPTNDQPRSVVKDETGRILVQCATILGAVLDPGHNVVAYRRRLLRKFQPNWTVSDPNAKPNSWIDRCASGTFWENPDQWLLRTHNMSMNYKMEDIDIARCGSRLANQSTAKISCEIRINCGCRIVAPFPFLFDALSAMGNSFLGDRYAFINDDDRIVLKDGVGLVQVGDVGKSFNLVAFSGDINAHREYASSCRSTKVDKVVEPKLPWPAGRALIRKEFSHGLMDGMRDYGYVLTEGLGNLLIRRNNPMDKYRVIGVCIDERIKREKEGMVRIR